MEEKTEEEKEEEIKEKLIELAYEIENDKDNLAIAIEFLREEIDSSECTQEKLMEKFKDIPTWIDTIEQTADV